MTTLRFTSSAIVLLASLPAVAIAQCEPRFIVDSTQGYGFTADSTFRYMTRATHWDPDGDGPQPDWLVLGGRFTRAANVNSLSIVAWDGTSWRGFGTGLPQTGAFPSPPTTSNAPIVMSLGTFQNQLVTVSNAIRIWNGSTWVSVNPESNPIVSPNPSDLIEHQGSLYIGGIRSFRNASNQTVQYALAVRVAGSTFERLGPALSSVNDVARKFLSRPEGLYAVGSFTSLSDSTVLNNVALWNGSSWTSVGNGVNGPCEDGAFINNQLYIVGSFTQANGAAIRAAARWDGTQWHQLGDGSLTSAASIVEIDGHIYVGGQTASTSGVYRLDGNEWTVLEGGMTPTRMVEDRGDLIALGATSTGVDQGIQFPATDALRLTSDGWQALGAPYDYVGGGATVYQGRFIGLVGQRRDRVQNRYGEWDGTTWRPFEMPAGFNPQLESTGDRMFGFTRSTQNPITERVYEYADGAWRDLQSTLAFASGPPIYRAIEYAGNTYLYGTFNQLNGQPVRGLLRADGDTWTPVALPTQSAIIYSAAVHDGVLYLSGQFTDDDGQTTGLASYDGNTFANYPAPSSFLYSLTSFAGDLLLSSFDRVARWNGSAFEDYWMPPQSTQFNGVFVASNQLWAVLYTTSTTDFAVGGMYLLARRGANGTTDFTSEPIGIRRGDSTINSPSAFPVVYGSEVHLFGNFNQIGAANLPGNRVVKNWTRFTVDGVPLIVTQPDDVITSCGSPVELRATIASGYDADGSLEYQWYLNGNALSETQFTRGVNTDTLTIPALAQPFTGIYTLTVTNSCGTATSREIFVSGDTPDCRACSPCAADFDFDGGVTGDDVAAFFTAYETNAPCADVDASGGVDGTDLAHFFSLFEAGGC